MCVPGAFRIINRYCSVKSQLSNFRVFLSLKHQFAEDFVGHWIYFIKLKKEKKSNPLNTFNCFLSVKENRT